MVSAVVYVLSGRAAPSALRLPFRCFAGLASTDVTRPARMVSHWIEHQAGWSVRKFARTAQPLPDHPDPGPVTHCHAGCRVRRRSPANVNDVPRYVALGDGPSAGSRASKARSGV